MRRKDFLALTGLNAQAFYGLERRGQLPFRPREAIGDGVWAEFSIEDAFRTRLALELANEGVTQQVAGQFVRTEFSEMAAALDERKRPPRSDIYLGYLRDHIVGDEYDAPAYGKALAFGTAPELAVQILRWEKRLAKSQQGLSALIFVNVSYQLRLMIDCAKDAGLAAHLFADLVSKFGVAP